MDPQNSLYTGYSYGGAGNTAPVLPSLSKPQPSQQPDMTQPTQPGQGESWLERLIPTGTSILGGLVGSLADPFIGPAGTIGGSAVGSALGQQIENSLTGKKSSTAGAALQGGLGALAGEGIGSVVGSLGTKAGQAATDLAETKAAQAEASNLAGEFGSALPAAKQTALKLGDSVNLAKSLGIDATQPGTAQAMTDLATNANTFYNGVKQAALKEAGPVDLTNVDQVLQDAVTKNMGGLKEFGKAADTPADSLYRDLVSTKENTIFPGNPMEGTGGGLDYTQIDPQNAYELVQNVGAKLGDAQDALAQQVKNSLTGTPDVNLQNQVAALKDAYSGVKGLVYNRPEVQKVLGAITDMSPEEVAARVPGLDPASPLAAKLAGDANGAGDMQSLLTEQSKFMNMLNASKQATNFNNQAVAIPAAERQAAKAAAEAEASSLGGKTMAGADSMTKSGILNKMFNVLGGSNAAVDKGVAGTAAALTAGGAISPINSAAQLAAHLPTIGGTPAGAPGPGGVLQDMNGGYNTQGPDTSNIGNEVVLAGMFDPAAVPALMRSQQSAAAQAGLNALERSYAAAGGGAGFGNGLLNELASFIPGTAANQYNQQKAALASNLAESLGLDKSEAASLIAALPSLMANPEGAQNAFTGIQGRINPMAAPGATHFYGPSVLSGIAQ